MDKMTMEKAIEVLENFSDYIILSEEHGIIYKADLVKALMFSVDNMKNSGRVVNVVLNDKGAYDKEKKECVRNIKI